MKIPYSRKISRAEIFMIKFRGSVTWNFPINAFLHNLAHVTSRNCTNIAYPFESAISSAVGKQLSCLVGLLYSITFMSSALEDVIFCTRLFVGGVGASN